MKRIATFTLAILFACYSCNSQRRATRRIQRIAENHPELVAEQAHTIDTLLVLLPVQDSAAFSIVPLLLGDTITIPTVKGSFTIRIPEKRLDSIAVSYHAEQAPIRFTDTIRYAQVVIDDEHQQNAEQDRRNSGRLIGIAIIAATITTLVLLIRKMTR